MRSTTKLGATFALTILTSSLAAQSGPSVRVAALPPSERPSIFAARVNAPMRIDGRLDEPVWRAARPATAFTQREPDPGAPATRVTEVRMLVTDDAVIIGARLADDRAALFGTMSPGQDGVLGGYISDYFEVQIDAHREHNSAFALMVTPAGERRSWLVTRDGSRDESWEMHWTAATHVDGDGWSLEMKIPLSELHVRPGAENWGIQFVRFSWRRQETDVLVSHRAN